VLVLVNVTGLPASAVQVLPVQAALVWKLAPSGVSPLPGVTLKVLEVDEVLLPLPTVSVTVKLPVCWYVWLADALFAVPPSPKVHAQLVGSPVLVLVNVTA
jgi:hypothetical protein